MRLLSFLKRKSEEAAAAPAKPKAGAKASAKPSAPPEPADSVQQARIRARQRVIGAVVLVVAGVIGFPLLFETQPRPLSVDTPIDIARRDTSVQYAPAPVPRPAAPLAVLPAPGAVMADTVADAGREAAPVVPPPVPPAPVVPEVSVKPEAPQTVPEPVEPKPKPAEPRAAEPKPPVVAAKPPPKPASAPEKKPAAKPVDAARAQALLEGAEAARKPEPEAVAGARFIVQVGAFAEMPAAREARQKVEKLGLKTYTQVVETSAGNRIRVRVGPFTSRADADKAAGKIKSAGLSSAVFTL